MKANILSVVLRSLGCRPTEETLKDGKKTTEIYAKLFLAQALGVPIGVSVRFREKTALEETMESFQKEGTEPAFLFHAPSLGKLLAETAEGKEGRLLQLNESYIAILRDIRNLEGESKSKMGNDEWYLLLAFTLQKLMEHTDWQEDTVASEFKREFPAIAGKYRDKEIRRAWHAVRPLWKGRAKEILVEL